MELTDMGQWDTVDTAAQEVMVQDIAQVAAMVEVTVAVVVTAAAAAAVAAAADAITHMGEARVAVDSGR